MYKQNDFDPQRDFAPVVPLPRLSYHPAARPNAPYASLKDFLAYAKANTGKATEWVSRQWHSGPHHWQVVGQQSGDRIRRDAISRQFGDSDRPIGRSHSSVGIDSLAAYVPSVRRGRRSRALAIASSQRWSKLPDIADGRGIGATRLRGGRLVRPAGAGQGTCRRSCQS